MELHHVSKSYGEKGTGQRFSYTVLKIKSLESSDQTAVENRPIKMMAGLVQPDSGRLKWETVKIGYFVQKNRDG